MNERASHKSVFELYENYIVKTFSCCTSVQVHWMEPERKEGVERMYKLKYLSSASLTRSLVCVCGGWPGRNFKVNSKRDCKTLHSTAWHEDKNEVHYVCGGWRKEIIKILNQNPLCCSFSSLRETTPFFVLFFVWIAAFLFSSSSYTVVMRLHTMGDGSKFDSLLLLCNKIIMTCFEHEWSEACTHEWETTCDTREQHAKISNYISHLLHTWECETKPHFTLKIYSFSVVVQIP